MKNANPHVDLFIRSNPRWQPELEKIRKILLSFEELQEEIMFAHPCYTFQFKNVAILGVHKDQCIISFFKGKYIPDPEGLLEHASNKAEDGRIIKFSSLKEIEEMEPEIKNYIREAINLEKLNFIFY